MNIEGIGKTENGEIRRERERDKERDKERERLHEIVR